MLLALLSLAGVASAHSWVEQLTVIAPNGTFTGKPGYARNYIPRSAAGWSDNVIVNEIATGGQDVPSTTPLCRADQQTPRQNDGFARLQAKAGSAIALRYQENGHVTQPGIPAGKPQGGGLMYVYGTTQPIANETLVGVHKQWNQEGTGGDKRGVLLATSNFDDGRCYQINQNSQISVQRQAQFPHQADALMGMDIWCQMDLALPSNAPTGQPYTLYWVWDWPTEGQGAHPQLYTTCMDVDIVADAPGQQKNVKVTYVDGQDLNNAAIPGQLANLNAPSIAGGQGAGSSDNATSIATITSSASNSGSAQPTAAADRVTITETATVTETLYVTRPAGSQATRTPNQRRSAKQVAAQPKLTDSLEIDDTAAGDIGVLVTSTYISTTYVVPPTPTTLQTLTSTKLLTLPEETSEARAEIKRDATPEGNSYVLRGRNPIFARPAQRYSIPRPPSED